MSVTEIKRQATLQQELPTELFLTPTSIKDFMEALDTTALSADDPNKKPLMVIDCFATWCPPCKAIAPKYEEFSKQYTQAVFYKVNVDDVEQVAMELGVKAMPTFVFFQDGTKVAEVVGANVQKIQETIEQFLT